jgi:diaminopimelate epimerase
MRKIAFSKYHGLENDFLVIGLSAVRLTSSLRGDLTRKICNRHIGIGADGVVFYSARRDKFRMQLFNADGSEAEISGNGLRILAQHIYGNRLTRARSFAVDTAIGNNKVEVVWSRGNGQSTRIVLSKPLFRLSEIPMRGRTSHFINRSFETGSGRLIGTAVNVGNPHIVFFVDNFEFDWRTYGAEVERDRRFPQRTNVEFAVIRTRSRVEHRSWERGAGETRASGTGAAAVVAAGVMNGLLDHKVSVHEPAGLLEIELGSLDQSIQLIGPSTKIGDGVFLYDVNAKNHQ